MSACYRTTASAAALSKTGFEVCATTCVPDITSTGNVIYNSLYNKITGYVCVGQLSLIPSVGWEMSASQSAVMLCGWGLKAGMVHSTCGYMYGWQVKLCDPSLTRAIPQHLGDESL